jgi:protein SCO1/2
MQQSTRTTYAIDRPSVLLWTVFTIAALALPGCRAKTVAPADDGQPPAMAGDVATYQLKGIVVSSDAAKGEVSVDSEAIPGFMGAMIMPYKLAQPGIATELHPGDRITARLRVSSSAAVLDQIVVTAQAKPDYKPSKFYNVPAPGQTVPDFHFLNQNAKTISLHQFHGKVLLVTFVYTRCPLPDYCIRMSRNFATIEHELAADPELYKKTHLLSVSFDPAHDTPKVLRAYGGVYIGEPADKTFAHWDFAAPPPSELDTVEQFFDVGVSPGSDSTLTHSLSTVVIAPDGKIFRFYPTNDWAPSSVVADVKQLLAE